MSSPLSLSLSLSALRDCQRAAHLFPCFSPPRMHRLPVHAATKGHAARTYALTSRGYLLSFLSKEPEAIVHNAPSPSLCLCPFGLSSPCTEGVLHRTPAGRQPSIKLMYELQTRDARCLPVYPRSPRRPTPFRAAPFLFSFPKENHTPSGPTTNPFLPLSSTFALTNVFRTFPESVAIFPLNGYILDISLRRIIRV